MDVHVSQYVGCISAQGSGVEMIANLTITTTKLVQAFKDRNKQAVPKRVVIYRDGVSEGQFSQVINQEIMLIKAALPPDTQVAVIVCQKRHTTRFFCQDGDSSEQMMNVGPGVIVDCNGDPERSIASPTYNQFYLTSHVAIQGTVKPCKYTLIYDEIGFKLSEVELY